MSVEQTVAQEEVKTEEKPKVVGFGKSIKGAFVPNLEANVPIVDTVNKEVEAKADDVIVGEEKKEVKAEEKVAEVKAEEKTEGKYSDEQKKEILKEVFGDDSLDIEALKEKLKNIGSEKKEPTQAEVSKKEIAAISELVSLGGNPEQFQSLKELAKIDISELSKKDIAAELIAGGFNEEEVNTFLESSIDAENIEDSIEQDFDNETDEEFEARKKSLVKQGKLKAEFMAKMFAVYSLNKQKQAEGLVKQLYDAVEQKDLEAKDEAALSSNVDEWQKTLSRKQTIELGKANDIDLAPIEHEYSEGSIKQVAEILKNPQQRNNFFKKEDGSLNLSKLAQLLLENIEYKRAIKGALLEGQSRISAIVDNRFPNRTPFELGVGGSPTKNVGKGEVVKLGKTQRVRAAQY